MYWGEYFCGVFIGLFFFQTDFILYVTGEGDGDAMIVNESHRLKKSNIRSS